jgi:two-component system phosphate regulon sensor histidine kinase PhoR
MIWFALLLAHGLAAGVAVAIWRKWIAPWRELEALVAEITASRQPRTFLLEGAEGPRRIGIALEQISIRQRALSEKIQSEEFNVEAILSAMLDGLVVVDRGGIIRLANPEFGKLFGVAGKATGRTLLEVIRDAAVAELVTQTLLRGEARREVFKMPARSGEGTPQIDVSAVPIAENPGAIKGAVVLFHDVTKLQQLEGVRRDFVANVSHELRTPLSILHGYLETLIDYPTLPASERSRILEVMTKHSGRLTLLVEDLLSLAKLEAPESHLHFTALEMQTFLSSILRDWAKKFDAKQLRAELDVSTGLPTMRADESRLQEVVYNLLDNAVKYSPTGGRIDIRAELRGEQIALTIADEGTGIPGRDLPRIFERFYRVDKARSREIGGTGLGLAIVKHIARLHGGSVEAESELGRGTTIRVLLPVSGGPAPSAN